MLQVISSLFNVLVTVPNIWNKQLKREKRFILPQGSRGFRPWPAVFHCFYVERQKLMAGNMRWRRAAYFQEQETCRGSFRGQDMAFKGALPVMHLLEQSIQPWDHEWINQFSDLKIFFRVTIPNVAWSPSILAHNRNVGLSSPASNGPRFSFPSPHSDP